MNKLTKILLVGVVAALVAILSLPIFAQEMPGAGEGGPIILPNFGADISTLNPFLSTDGTSSTVWARLYPALLGLDNEVGYYAPGAAGGLVSDWSISDDGLVYTFTLRDDWVWSDGTPVTSADVLYSWEVIVDENVTVNSNLITLRDLISSVEAPDAQTVVITFVNPDCNALDSAATIPVVPAHVWREAFPNNADMNESDFNLTAPVTSGVWRFLNYRPGEQVTLVPDQNYPDAEAGYIVPQGWIFKNVADQTIQVEQFLNGQLTTMGVPQNRQQELLDLVNGGQYVGFESERANYRFVGLNLADPSNPQPGLDEEGNLIEQGIHPILGDVRVRQALNYAMNFEELNEGAFFGFGIQGATHSRPDSWAHNNDIQPYPFDPERAAELLEEAGWTDSDGDGVRECNGCETAEAGTLLEFELLTNAGNTSQEALGTILQDQWGQVGFNVNFQAIDFNVLVETFTGQTFDAVMIFWGFGFPADPDGITVTFAPENDVPGIGFNAVSYSNERVTELLDEARALPGCDLEERAALYGEVQQILHDESPWIWIGGSKTLTVGQPYIQGWSPMPNAASPTLWNEDSWVIPVP
ncbi:MAG: ABC transporter substrate-binding protein [Anaerolineae bacterium]|jgi:peptide/nickel transport system substrate-binding protein|nr:ABC transporter substrate-binding protein [Anaerolineae bacterium]